MKKIILLGIFFVLIIGAVQAVRLPEGSEKNWATSTEYGIENWLLVSHTENGTLKQLNTTFNDLNISSNLIVIGNIFGEIPDSFKNQNFTTRYNLRTDRWQLNNFTNAYDNRNGRWSLGNFTSSFTARLGELWNLGNFTSAYQNRIAELWNLGNFTTAFQNRIGELYNKENVTSDYPNLDLSLLDDYALSNFTNNYDARSDRYNKENFTAQINANGFFNLGNYSAEYSATGYKLGNFTSDYDTRLERFNNNNFTARLNLEGDIIRVGNLSQVIPANEKNPTNATIQIGTSQVTNLADFVVANEVNPTNTTIQITESQISDLRSYLLIAGGTLTGDVNITGELDVSGVSGSLTNTSVVCVKTNGDFGVCTSHISNGGTCTCG